MVTHPKFVNGLLLFTVLLLRPCAADEVRYERFNSIQEVIDYESSQILAIPSYDYPSLCDAYVSRGESYLLAGEYILALEDLQNGYEYAASCKEEESEPRCVRALFALALAYANLDMPVELHATCDAVKTSLDYAGRRKCHEESATIQTVANHQPILGPDKISIKECVNRAQNTATLARALVVPAKAEFQFTLNLLIDDLEKRAKSCCYSGGLWKGCLQALIDKWHQWNQKWKVFGIAPDPSWD